MSDFTLGVVNVWGGECLGGERLTIAGDMYTIEGTDLHFM